MDSDRRLPVGLLLGAAFVVTGLYGRSAALLLLAVPPLLYAAALLASHTVMRRPDLDATRAPSVARVTEGDLVDMNVAITNRGPSVAFAAVLDELPEGATLVSGEPAVCGPFPRQHTLRISYRLRTERGLHVQTALRVLVWARFGLSLEEYRFACASSVAALPEIESLPPLAVRPRKTHIAVGPVKARVAGPGVEFFGCRAYAPGDDIRRLNWRSFAKHDRPLVNEYEDERMTDVIVVLDVRANAHVRAGMESTFEPSCRAAASLAAHSIHQSNRVGLLMYGQTIDWIQPAGGRMHLDKILGMIARARPARSFAFEDLANLPLQMLPSGSQVLIVSPVSRAGDALVAAKLRARGCSVLVFYADALELECAAEPDDEALDLAVRARRLEMANDFRVMESLGVHVIPWTVRQPLAGAIRTAQLDRPVRRLS